MSVLLIKHQVFAWNLYTHVEPVDRRLDEGEFVRMLMAKSAKYPSKVDLKIWQFCLRERLPQWAKLLYFEWTPLWHLYVLLLTNLLSQRYQPLPLQASHCVFLFWSVTLPAGSAASLANVTWRHRLQFRLQNKHAKTCWSPPASLMSCRLQCSLKNKHAKTCWRPPESLMSCRLRHSLENKHARTLWETIWISDGMSPADEAGQQTRQDIPGHHLIQDRTSDSTEKKQAMHMAQPM